MVFRFHETISIMAVGKSGVGKSTIGNFLLTGEPGAGDDSSGFETSSGVKSCTQTKSWKSSKICCFGDVPGIPDTNPKNTKAFYDIIIQEARTGLHAILFIFKKDRIDPAAYERAKLLFREFQENSTVPKILIINDHTNYGFSKEPTDDELAKQASEIERTTSIHFQSIIYLNTNNMKDRMKDLLNSISSFKKATSPKLRTYDQLEEWVQTFKNKEKYEADIVNCRKYAITKLEIELKSLEVALITATAAATLATIGAFFTFGATLGIATPTGAVAVAADTAIEVKKSQLRRAREAISTTALAQAAKDLEDAVKSFKEFNAALSGA